MRDVVIGEIKKGFHPVDVSFTIESEEELRELWHRVNINLYYLWQGLTPEEQKKYPYNLDQNFDYLFYKLEELVKILGVKL